MASTAKSAAPAVTPTVPSTKPRKRPLACPPPSEPLVDGDQVAVATHEAKPELIKEVSHGKHPRVTHTIKCTNVTR
ncbi:hypothetical protein FRC10_003436, partial [Ceratobasidium sp. 414]